MWNMQCQLRRSTWVCSCMLTHAPGYDLRRLAHACVWLAGSMSSLSLRGMANQAVQSLWKSRWAYIPCSRHVHCAYCPIEVSRLDTRVRPATYISYSFDLFAERCNNQIPCAFDLVWIGKSGFNCSAVHWLGCAGGGRGPQTQEQSVQSKQHSLRCRCRWWLLYCRCTAWLLYT